MESVDDSTASSLRDQIVHLELLRNAARQLNSTLDLNSLLEQIVSEVAEAFGCSRSAVLLIDEDTQELELVAVRGWTKNVHPKGFRFTIGRDGLVGKVAATGQTSYVPDVRKEPAYIVSEESTRSELDIPLKVRGKIIGLFNAQHPEVDAFPGAQRSMLEALADNMATAIENARLFQAEKAAKEALERDSANARQMQKALLPKLSMRMGEFSICGTCVPIHAVGGDWFDYFPLDNQRIGITLGDVSGKGMSAALLMAASRSSLRHQAKSNAGPGAVLTGLNEMLRSDFPQGNFVTLIYGVLNTATSVLTMAAAGHPPPLLLTNSSTDSSVVELELPNGLPLGLGEWQFEEVAWPLRPDTSVLFYSDGVVEAEDAHGMEFGLDRLKRACLRAEITPQLEVTPQLLIDEACRFASPGPMTDDATALLIRRNDAAQDNNS
jgi:sigma-B regulation protein RsbU (phosphoserine phosphatase)